MNNFYVDDALKSFPTEEEAIDLLRRAQEALAASNLRLHKIAANRAKVMDAFPNDNLAKDIKCLDLSTDDLPDQRSLGVKWNLMSDTFSFQVPDTEKSYTRRSPFNSEQLIRSSRIPGINHNSGSSTLKRTLITDT